MKKYLSILLFLCFLCFFATACSDEAGSRTEGNNYAAAFKSADVDLTALSSTMAYAEISNIMTNPDGYFGKTIKMNGPYAVSFYDKTGQYYHYIVIEDATACCQAGVEFIWDGDHTYPDDYPEVKTMIEVVGVFKSYEELGRAYYYLAVDDIMTI